MIIIMTTLMCTLIVICLLILILIIILINISVIIVISVTVKHNKLETLFATTCLL